MTIQELEQKIQYWTNKIGSARNLKLKNMYIARVNFYSELAWLAS